MRKLQLLGTIVLAMLYGHACYSQDFSNKGKDFWVIYTGHIDGTTSRMALYITSDVNATGTVTVAGNTINFTVTANQVTTVRLTNTSTPPNSVAYNGQVAGIGTNTGIHILSDNPVVVYSHILNAARSGSTLVLPTNVLGREYYVSSYRSNTNAGMPSRRTEFAVVATQDNTTVEINATVPDGNNTYAANTPFQIILNKGDVFQYQSANDADVTGTYIKSIASAGSPCKPIAVFAGSTWTAMGCPIPITGGPNAGSGDNLYQQLFPLVSWGQQYITAPFISRSYDIFRILVKDPSTVVQVNGVTLNAATLISNTYYDLNTSGNNTPRIITSDKPICVVQYMITQNCDGVNSDPEMVILNSVEQTIKDITVLSARNDLTPPATNIANHYLNIIVPTNGLSSLLIDGAPYTATAIPVATTTYSYLQENITASTNINPTHRVTCDSGFLAIAYGYGNVESYGYNAGTNVRDLYQFVSIHNQYATVPFPAGCTNSPFQFSMTFPYQPTQINWVFGAALNAMGIADVTISNPVFDSTWVVNGKTLYRYKLTSYYSVTAPGTYPIKVLAQNPTPDGCSGLQEINYDLQIFNPPVADFNFTNNGCFNDVVAFFDNSNTGGRPVIHRHWDFGDLTSSAMNNPTHLYSAANAYNVKYAIITDVGCLSDTTTHIVTLIDLPVADFDVQPAPNCVGVAVAFTNTSTVAPGHTIDQWSWNFGDPGSGPLNVSALEHPGHVFASPGIYSVTLQVQTHEGCSSTVYSFPVNIISDATIALTSATGTDDQTVCINDPVTNITYSVGGSGNGGNVSGLPAGVTGTYSAGVITITGIPSVSGVFIYTVNTEGPCVRPNLTGTIHIIEDATISLTSAVATTNQAVCRNSAITDITYAVGASGTGGSVSGLPAGLTGIFAGGVITISGSPSVSGTFIYTVNTTGPCVTPTATGTIHVYPLPTSDFNYSAPSCETRTVNFQDMSLPNAGNNIKWQWDFDDGSPVITINAPASPNVTHSFATAGTYNVMLTVTTDNGCVSITPPKQVVIRPGPLAGFITPEVCLSDTYASFIDTSKIALPDAVLGWQWNFGDPGSGSLNVSSLQNPQHSYSAVGPYTVELITTSNNGCKDTIYQQLFVNGSFPAANFTVPAPASLCANDSVIIAEASTVFPGTITKVEIYWDNTGLPAIFDTDDLPFSGKLYKHLYPNFQSPLTKTFTIRYRAYSGGVCVNDKIRNITVNAAPLVQFNNLPDICLDAASYQITQANEIGGVPGNGSYSGPGVTTGGLFDPAIAGPGIHTILYTFTSLAGGCVDTMSATIRVYDPPIAGFGYSSPACETKAITFTDNSNPSVGALTIWTWDFDDGTALVVRNNDLPFTHVFATWGVYNVKLFVTTSNGCRSVAKIIPVTIHPQPKPNFSIPASACLPNAAVSFADISTIADGTEANFIYSWDFGDPPSGSLNVSALSDPSHVYTTTGPFNVNLQVTSGDGCMHDTTIILNTVHPQPLGSFTVNKTDVCIGSGILFTNTSDPIDGITVQYNWTMDDGNLMSTPAFNYIYNNLGTYNVSLFVFNNHGCRSTTYTKTVSVNPYPPVNAGPDKFMLQGGQVTLTPVLTATMPVTYLWSPPDHLDNPAIAFAVASPPEDKTYVLKITTDKGCSAKDDVFIKVLKLPAIPNIFSPNGDGIHDTWSIQYLESYPGCTVDIFNRYGQLIWHSEGYTNPWDGTIHGKAVPVGTYYYIVSPKNGRKQMSGYVDVIR